MKTYHAKLVLILVAGLTVLRINGQEMPNEKHATTGASPEEQTLKPGDFIFAETDSSIDVRKAHAGDPFQAKVKSDVWAIGKITLPHGTRLVGRVLEAQPRNKTTQESRLVITLDKAVLKDGTEFALRAVIQSIVKSPHSQDSSATQPWTQTAPPNPRPGNNPGTDPFFNNTVRNQRSSASASNTLPVPSSSDLKITDFGTVTVFTSTKDDVKVPAHTLVELRVVASRQ